MTPEERIKQLADLRVQLVAEIDRVNAMPLSGTSSHPLGDVLGYMTHMQLQSSYAHDRWAKCKELESCIKWAGRALEMESIRADSEVKTEFEKRIGRDKSAALEAIILGLG